MSKQHAPWPIGEAPASWDLVQWPDWVPQEVRAQIVSFWGTASFGRGPKDYEEQHRTNYANAPEFGAAVELLWDGRGKARPDVQGRYVHAWNNIGRMVAADGTVHCCASHEFAPEVQQKYRVLSAVRAAQRVAAATNPAVQAVFSAGFDAGRPLQANAVELCRSHGMQCCHACPRTECCDNTRAADLARAWAAYCQAQAGGV